MGGALTAERLGQLLGALPPYEPGLALDLLRRAQAAQGLAVPKLAAITVEEAAGARAQIAGYRAEVSELAKKLHDLQPTAPAVELPEFGL